MAAINFGPEPRPCMVDGDIKCLFHMWVQVSEIVPPSALRGGHSGGVVSDVLGLIEYESGRVDKVRPSRIRFLDTGNLFHENALFFREEKE